MLLKNVTKKRSERLCLKKSIVGYTVSLYLIINQSRLFSYYDFQTKCLKRPHLRFYQ